MEKYAKQFPEKEAEAYAEALRTWFGEYKQWRAAKHELIRLRLRFENLGRVPTYDARVDVHFPTPFDEPPEESPMLLPPPERLEFTRHRIGLPNLGLFTSGLSPTVLSPHALGGRCQYGHHSFWLRWQGDHHLVSLTSARH